MQPEDIQELVNKAVADALESTKKVTNIQDLALIAANGDQKFMKVPFVQQDFPRTVYRGKKLTIKGGATSLRVFTRNVKNAAELAQAESEGWLRVEPTLPAPVEIDPFADETLDPAIFADLPPDVPVPPMNPKRPVGRPPKHASV